MKNEEKKCMEEKPFKLKVYTCVVNSVVVYSMMNTYVAHSCIFHVNAAIALCNTTKELYV